ncbi:trimeric LpxA-like protein [Rhodotorula diobovata]|uniref:Dynactin subunit 6 n=1 Tax=Rhodotorula diobovata TaxID=5288 RepID=A0A5C5G302_9BASI|nr:trimeric LpxA-like protein [Rhodotorula diobovata]
MSSRDIKDSFKVGSRTVVVQDCDLRGDITIGSGTVLHPRCTILAVGGPIIFGSNNIVEENVVIVNRLRQPMVIGDNNLFEVGCRIESPSIGDWNTFGIRSRVSSFVQVGSNCVVGAGCIVLPSPFPNGSPFTTPQPPELPPKTTDAALLEVPTTDTPMSSPAPTPSGSPAPASPSPASAPSPAPRSAQTPSDSLPDYTHVFGSENRRRKASGEGTGQAKALFVKHWEYLRETLPKHHKLKMF